MKFILSLVFVTTMFGIQAVAQTSRGSQSAAAGASVTMSPIKSSPAFAELVLHRTELESELESLLLEYTDDYPKIVETRFGLAAVQKETERLLALKAEDVPKLTLALGKLIVKKVEHETSLRTLQKNYSDGHPEVKRAKRKVEIYEKAIKEILG